MSTEKFPTQKIKVIKDFKNPNFLMSILIGRKITFMMAQKLVLFAYKINQILFGKTIGLLMIMSMGKSSRMRNLVWIV